MEKKNYSSPKVAVIRASRRLILCQSTYNAPDVIFGGDGGAGSAISPEDINYGGSF